MRGGGAVGAKHRLARHRGATLPRHFLPHRRCHHSRHLRRHPARAAAALRTPARVHDTPAHTPIVTPTTLDAPARRSSLCWTAPLHSGAPVRRSRSAARSLRRGRPRSPSSAETASRPRAVSSPAQCCCCSPGRRGAGCSRAARSPRRPCPCPCSRTRRGSGRRTGYACLGRARRCDERSQAAEGHRRARGRSNENAGLRERTGKIDIKRGWTCHLLLDESGGYDIDTQHQRF